MTSPWSLSARDRRRGTFADPGASAAIDPGTFAVARDGQLTVSSSVLVTGRAVEMMGGWTNDSQRCDLARAHRQDHHRSRPRRKRSGSRTRRAAWSRTARREGPTSGSSSRRQTSGWPARTGGGDRASTFVTNTLHRARGLRAIADLFFKRTEAC